MSATRRDTPDFQSFYQNKLLPVLQEFEQQRLKVRTKTLLALSICGLLAIGGGLFFYLQGHLEVGVILAVLSVIVGGFVSTQARKGYVRAFKQGVVGRIASFVDKSIQYVPEGYVSQDDYRDSRIFKQDVDRYRGEDLFKGTQDKTEFRFSELHTEYKSESSDSKGNRQTTWHTIFRGGFFIADFHKNFQGYTVVLPDTAEKSFGWLGKKFQGTFRHTGELVSLDDPEFEREFVVYSSDQIEARYLLSHSMMQRILAFHRKGGSHLRVAFHHSNVYLAIDSNRDRFEPRVMKSVLDPELCREFLEDLLFIYGLIDDLNLNTRIWSKA